MNTVHSIENLPLDIGYQVPNNYLHDAFGELNLVPRQDRIDVVVTLLMEPVKEGSQTGFALDGSDSMQSPFGQGWHYAANYDGAAVRQLIAEGRGQMIESDGQKYFEPTPEGFAEMKRLGYIVRTENDVQPIAREVVPYLAEKIDADGGTTAIYWACGPQGEQIEVIGDLTADDARQAEYQGPEDWGLQTQLLPAVKYFVERFADAKWGFYVFITDGRLDDLEAVKDYTADLSRKIHRGAANPVKCVLIGVGSGVDEQQMIELDDLPDALDLPVDIWDHKIASSMRGLRDIFAEVVEENALIAPTGRVLTNDGTVAANFADGVPAILKFSLPREATGFTLEVAGGKIEQSLFGDVPAKKRISLKK